MEPWKLEKMSMDGFTPFSANVITYQERALLASGFYTIAQNVRDFRPGLRKRPGLEAIAPYNFLGPVVDLRPLYGDTVAGDGDDIFLGVGSTYSNTYATQASARSDVDDNLTSGTEHTATYCAPGWEKDGADFTVGRVAVSYNLSRLTYVSTVTAASLFLYVKGSEGPDSDINADAIRIVVVPEDSPYAPDDTGAPPNSIFDITLTQYSDVFSFDPADYGADHIVEVPLNSAAIAAINSAMTGLIRSIGFVIMEYDWDFLEDTGGSVSTDIDHYIEQRIDRYFPFLRLTFSDDVPACTSIFQYQQIRSQTAETLAYFENGDIVSANVAPPVTRGDVRISVTGGDNGGYYPYSDGTPSATYGLEESVVLAPSYDSKWGFFVYRSDGINIGQDFAHYHTEAQAIDDFKPSWGVLDDILLFANGDGYAKFYGGQDGQPCKASCVIVDPAGGDTGVFKDAWTSDGIEVVFPGAATTASEIYIFTPIQPTKYLVEVISANGDGVVIAQVWNGSTWSGLDSDYIYDTTRDGFVSFDHSGYLQSNSFLENKSQRLFGKSGYWMKFKMTHSSAYFTVKFKAFYNFETLENVWDGVLIDFVEAQVFVEDSGNTGVYYTYGNTTIDISDMTANDFVYFSAQWIPKQVYVDVGNTPNTATNGAADITLTFQYWDGDTWTAWPVKTDNSGGFKQTGFVTLSQTYVTDPEEGSQKQSFNGSVHGLHWFRVSVNATISSDTRISLQYEPTNTLEQFGTKVNCLCVWKERAIYSFDLYPSWIYVTRNGTVNVLNGDDYGPLQAGDGRRNPVVCMRKFHNELLVWQKEMGADGGCTTIFEGYTPVTFGKFLLSPKIGTLNADTAVVVDGALQASRSDYNQATLAYFLSNYGVFFTDGQTMASIHDQIRNYFDPTSPDCIRNGYQDKCWMVFDETHHVLRIGLVSGSSATEPNVFPVFDLMTMRWSFDAFASAHTPRCMSEISGDAATSAVQVVVLAGSKDADIFNASSTNLNDNGDTAIDMQVRIEFNASGHLLNLNEFALRFNRQAAGNITFLVYEDGELNTEYSKSPSMTQGEAGDATFVDRLMVGSNQESNVSVFMQNNTINQDLYLLDYWVDLDKLINR